MSRRHIFALSGLLFFVACSAEVPAEHAKAKESERTESCSDAQDGLSVQNAWVRATQTSSGMSALFMTICNQSDTDAQLVSVDAEIAGTVEIHETTRSEAGIVSMTRVDRVLAPAGGGVALAPGGVHVMLMELNGAIPSGSDARVMLNFDDGRTLTIDARAKSPAEAAAPHSTHHGAHHGKMHDEADGH